jgi:hypothetical protein
MNPKLLQVTESAAKQGRRIIVVLLFMNPIRLIPIIKGIGALKPTAVKWLITSMKQE